MSPRPPRGLAPRALAASPLTPLLTPLLPALLAALGLTPAAHAEPLTLTEALARASADHPELARAASDVALAEGELLGADRTPHNPELGLAVGPELGDPTGLAWQLSLDQTLELGGERAHRVDAARQRVAAATTRVDAARRGVVLGVRRAFQAALVARARRDAARDAERVASDLVALTDLRLARGAGNQLEVNVARADLGRARRERLDAERAYGAATSDLGQAIGAAPDAALEPQGDLPTFPPLVLAEGVVAARAADLRADLLAAAQDQRAAEALARAARAQATPDLTVGLDYARSGGVDTVLVTASLPLVVWDANEGGVATARAAAARAALDLESARREAERDARAAYRAYALAREAVLGFEPGVLATLGDTLALSQRSFEAGKIGLVELNVLQRELIAAQHAWLDALAEAVAARDALERAAALDLDAQE